MRIVLALAVGLFVVGCSHVDAVSDDPRLAVLERVHPGGHIPSIEHHSAAVAADDLAPAPSTRSKSSLVAKNDTDVVPADDLAGILGPSSMTTAAADDAFNSAPSKSKKSAKAKKTHHHSSHHQTQQ